jgi:hypothetical protein
MTRPELPLSAANSICSNPRPHINTALHSTPREEARYAMQKDTKITASQASKQARFPAPAVWVAVYTPICTSISAIATHSHAPTHPLWLPQPQANQSCHNHRRTDNSSSVIKDQAMGTDSAAGRPAIAYNTSRCATRHHHGQHCAIATDLHMHCQLQLLSACSTACNTITVRMLPLYLAG